MKKDINSIREIIEFETEELQYVLLNRIYELSLYKYFQITDETPFNKT